jgi:biotin carboxyl carrier protein
MRAQEEAWKEKLRALKAQETHEGTKAIHDEVVSPVMADVKAMLAETGDSVSKEALEKLAKWKIDL